METSVHKGFDGYRRFFGRSQWSVVWNLIVTCAILPSLYMYNIPLHPYLIMYISGSKIICSDIEIDLSNSAKQPTHKPHEPGTPTLNSDPFHKKIKNKLELHWKLSAELHFLCFQLPSSILRFSVKRFTLLLLFLDFLAPRRNLLCKLGQLGIGQQHLRVPTIYRACGKKLMISDFLVTCRKSNRHHPTGFDQPWSPKTLIRNRSNESHFGPFRHWQVAASWFNSCCFWSSARCLSRAISLAVFIWGRL